MVAALAAVVYFLVRAYLDRGGIHGSATAADDEAEAAERRRRIESLPFPVQAAQYDLLAEARRHYQQGHYGEAVKYLFSYQLVELDKHKIIRLTRGKTNRQYLGEVGAPDAACAGWSSRRWSPSRISSSATTRSTAGDSRRAGRGWISSRPSWPRGRE